ncbi:hypothetical protein ACQKLP_26325 [Chitinophaga sp. NPDC101104]|uniref:hypothetical protein n=1 Tax=Chitinophaga sp. NPDC101104 TaxID=3390561 RepID=UPI003D00EDCC
MTIVFIILAILAVIAGLLGLVYLKRLRQRRQLVRKKMQRITKLVEQLESGRELDSHDVLPFAANPATRVMAFALLHHFDLKYLFPQNLHTQVKAAESHLANWLEFPTELDAFPDEMEYLQTPSIDVDGTGQQYVQYEVFRFRVRPPHWAADRDWMLGVAGPYFPGGEPYDHPAATFSRLTQQDDGISPEEEARWVHENIYARSQVR